MTSQPPNPELAAAVTQGTTVLAAFRDEDEQAAKFSLAPRPDWRSHCYALAAALARLLGLLGGTGDAHRTDG
jgi:hypothetical protein